MKFDGPSAGRTVETILQASVMIVTLETGGIRCGLIYEDTGVASA